MFSKEIPSVIKQAILAKYNNCNKVLSLRKKINNIHIPLKNGEPEILAYDVCKSTVIYESEKEKRKYQKLNN